jgi:hypothetical protein
VLGLKGLQQRQPRLVRPPRAPRHLPHQLERPLRRAQVTALQAEIGIHHAHQRQARKVVPLRHQLRADDDVGVALRDLLDLGLERAGRPEEVRGQDRDLRVRKGRHGLLRHALHARAHGGHLALHPADGQTSGIGLVSPHWWHTRRLRNRCSTIRASQ